MKLHSCKRLLSNSDRISETSHQPAPMFDHAVQATTCSKHQVACIINPRIVGRAEDCIVVTDAARRTDLAYSVKLQILRRSRRNQIFSCFCDFAAN